MFVHSRDEILLPCLWKVVLSHVCGFFFCIPLWILEEIFLKKNSLNLNLLHFLGTWNILSLNFNLSFCISKPYIYSSYLFIHFFQFLLHTTYKHTPHHHIHQHCISEWWESYLHSNFKLLSDSVWTHHPSFYYVLQKISHQQKQSSGCSASHDTHWQTAFWLWLLCTFCGDDHGRSEGVYNWVTHSETPK
jgi:hypothetical protein